MPVFDYDPPERFVAGAVGQPGARAFFLQARAEGRLTTVGLEKFQVAALADRLDELLDEVLRRSGGTAEVPAVAPPGLADNDPLEQPLDEDFRVGTMALAWDAPREHYASPQQMEFYGRRIGQALGKAINQHALEQTVWQRAEMGMTSLLHSLNIAYRREIGRSELHYGIDHCPLCAAADASGIKSETETAHHALRAICQSLAQTIDPTLQFSAREGAEARHILSVQV